jgi:hypothetical protein
MVARRGDRQDAAAMCRLVLLWRSPLSASPEEAERWARAQVATLAGMRGIHHAELSRLAAPCRDVTAPHHWMLELHLDQTRAPEELVREPALAAFVGELRQLQLDPALVAAGPARTAGIRRR